MSEKIVQLNEKVIKGQLKELVRGGHVPTVYGPLLCKTKVSIQNL